MIHNAINQMLQSTEWGELDYLVVDMPPGTSDAPLTVMQVLTMDGFVVVTTPQELAKIDAKRSINMIRKLQVNVLGVVENMSGGIFILNGKSQNNFDSLGKLLESVPQINCINPLRPTAKPNEHNAIAADVAFNVRNFLKISLSNTVAIKPMIITAKGITNNNSYLNVKGPTEAEFSLLGNKNIINVRAI